MKFKGSNHNGGQVEAPKPTTASPNTIVPPASTNGAKFHTPLFDALEQGQSVAMPPSADAPRPVVHPPHDGGKN
jgi:hypothetical protein